MIPVDKPKLRTKPDVSFVFLSICQDDGKDREDSVGDQAEYGMTVYRRQKYWLGKACSVNRKVPVICDGLAFKNSDAKETNTIKRKEDKQ